MFVEYVLIFKYVFLCFGISLLLLGVSYFLVYQSPTSEKISIYECGFNAFDDSRIRFEIRFYLVAILFIIFDLEIVFLFPWVLILNIMSFYEFLIMMIFLFILLIGFIYEWSKGALEWQ